MSLTASLLVLLVACQILPPDTSNQFALSLRTEQRVILNGEVRQLRELAGRLSASKHSVATEAVLKALPPLALPDGSSPFDPLPDVVSRPIQGLASVSVEDATGTRFRSELAAIRDDTAKQLFELAERAGTSQPPHYAIADACLRQVLERQPDHPESRRLLGFVPYEEGWARPFAISQLRKGKVFHQKYGWTQAAALPNLERGELPAPVTRGSTRVRWLPATDADALRRDWRNGWEINTEHFFIKTNVPFSEAITFGRQVEAFHDLFLATMV